jgi:hypothetical protein
MHSRKTNLELHETELSSAAVLATEGRLDTTRSPMLEKRLRDMVTGGHTRIVRDPGRVGSAGPRVRIVAGKLLAGPSSEHRRLSGFTDLFAIAADHAKAVAEFG